MAGKCPEFIRREMSHSFHGLNRNKIGLALDLKEGQHREALLDLIGQSDLVIENFTAGTLDRLGLGYDAMAKGQPGGHVALAVGIWRHVATGTDAGLWTGVVCTFRFRTRE